MNIVAVNNLILALTHLAISERILARTMEQIDHATAVKIRELAIGHEIHVSALSDQLQAEMDRRLPGAPV